MNFHDTKMGRNFFEHQLPQLIHTIQTLTTALNKPVHAVTLSSEADPDFLSDLYYGNYEPDIFFQDSESREYTRSINAAYDALRVVLSEDELKKVDNYVKALKLRDDADMERAYESGFRVAVKMIVAGLSRRPGQANGAA